MLISPTPMLTAWKNVLALCPTVIAAGNQDSQFWYPNVTLSPGTVFPLYLLAEMTAKRTRIADGARGLRGGQLLCTFYLPLSLWPTAGDCELFARKVEAEIWDPRWINVTDVPAFAESSVALASDPLPGSRAAGDDAASPQTVHRTITLTVDCGLSR